MRRRRRETPNRDLAGCRRARCGLLDPLHFRNVINISATSSTQLGIVWSLVYLTCPIALAHHYAVNFYSVLLINAATYALVGSVVETTRRQYKSRMISN